MLCEKCKKNEAKINLVKVVNGEKQQIWLCENCAKDISSIPFFNPTGDAAGFPFQEVLTGLLSSVENSIPGKVEKTVCHSCGMTKEEFIKTGKAGCANCYSVFRKQINEANGTAKYKGRIPKVGGEELIQRNNLKNLKQKLQELIVKEEYEEAAVVRDKIRDIEKHIIESNINKNKINLEEENCNEKLD